jgi:hypothetical protein
LPWARRVGFSSLAFALGVCRVFPERDGSDVSNAFLSRFFRLPGFAPDFDFGLVPLACPHVVVRFDC